MSRQSNQTYFSARAAGARAMASAAASPSIAAVHLEFAACYERMANGHEAMPATPPRIVQAA